MKLLYFFGAIILIMGGCQTGMLQEQEVAVPQQVELQVPAGTQSGEPNLFVSPEGTLYVSWIEAVNDSIDKLRYAVWRGDQWSAPKTIVEGKNWFVNWADFPSLVAMDSLMAAHWLVKSDTGTYDYNIQVALSYDRGNTWQPSFVLHQDGIAAEHGFVTMLPLASDKIFAVWLDGRNSKAGQPEQGEGGMQLQATFIGDQGNRQKEITLDDRVCECCQTDAALTDEGLVVVYRNRTEEEVRDIYIIKEQANGWSDPRPVHHDGWKITGCPVNGPAVAASGNRVAVAWFSAASEKEPKVQVAFSDDGGVHFAEPIRVDHGSPLGRVDITMLDHESALVSWMEANQEGAVIQMVLVTAEGKKEPAGVLASTMASRASGFPVMEKANDHVYFAWTHIDSIAAVRTAYMPVNAFINKIK